MAIMIANNPAAMMPGMAPTAVNGQITNQISIGDLLDLAIKKTYRELSHLAELLPRKTDMERKIEIMLFANRNRQLFVRLLALVKWAGSASKVEKCSQIVSFLDKQSMLFTDTADILARLSRETLVKARFPAFQLLAAVEVMTLGTYSRLPTCIRDRLVPPDPIPNSEKLAALMQLNHIIQQRLVASDLPLQMRNIKIEFGRVTFTVPNEFSLSLTLLSDNPNMPWRVLNIEILIEDKEINDLVAPHQLLYLRNFIQLRLNENVKPLMEAYNILHTFCLGLQLQVLCYQSYYLQYERLKDFIHNDEYMPGKHLILSYWKDSEKGSSFNLIVKIDSAEPCKPLQIQHIPELSSKAFLKTIQASILSIEKILLFTTHERSKLKLVNLKKFLEEKQPHLICELNELPAVLNISFIQPCMPSEQLLVSVDMLTGKFLAHIPQYLECPIVTELKTFLNKDMEKIIGHIERLKLWITRERCKKTVEALPVRTMETLPFPPNYSHESFDIPGQKIYFQFNRHQDKCLMVAFDNDSSSKYSWNTIWMEYYLVHVCHTFVSDISRPMPAFDQEGPKHFMEILKVLPLDSSSILHNFYQNNNNGNINEPVMASSAGLKRKLGSEQLQLAKRQKLPGYYITELAHIVSFCDERLTYNCLSTELYKRHIHHQVVSDLNGYTHYIDIIKFPTSSWCPAELTDKIQENVLCCTIRSNGKSSKLWNLFISFAHPPFQNLPMKEHCFRKIVNNSYDGQSGMVKMVDELLFDWTAIARLYDVVEKFAHDIKSTTLINIASLEIKLFTYKKISIGYGQAKMFFVSVYYKSSEKRFQLSFGVSSQAFSNTNPHILIANQLQHEFNQHLSIVQLIHVLNYTLNPLLTIQNLKSIPLLGTVNSRPNLPVLSFCVLPEASNHVKLIYRNTYCLDIIMYADNLVSIRDGALSNFDNSKVINDFMPIPGLKAFLSKFVDKTVQTRRLSQTEDDNPPSPVAQQIEYNDNYMYPGSQMKGTNISMGETSIPTAAGRSSAALQPHPSPHTPASPLTSVLGAHSTYAPSPGLAHSLSSPPSHPGMQQQNPIAPSPQMHPLEQSPASTFNINSPMSANLAAPSPSFMPTPSPGPSSSFHTHSPASQFMSQNTPQNHESGIGSPFNQPNMPPSIGAPQSLSSPAANLWPGSPSVSRPSPRPVTSSQSPGGASLINSQANVPQAQYSHGMQPRSLPQKPWAAALPTMLNHQGFEMMCRPNDNMNIRLSNVHYSYSQLERFLGATFMRRHFNKPIEEYFTIIPTGEPGTIMFKNETLQFKIWMDFNTFQIHLNVKSLSDMNQWAREELDILQQYFETKVASAPYKPNSFYTFSRFLTVPTFLLKDLIRLMRLELHPDPLLKWTLQINLTIAPFGFSPSSAGMSAFIMSQQKKFMIFIQLASVLGGTVTGPIHTEPFILALPLIYDITVKSLSIGWQTNSTPTIMSYVDNFLKSARYAAQQNNESCILYPAIRDIMNNLEVP